MEKIRINNNDILYEIKDIQQISDNILRIDFSDDIPEAFEGPIQVFTSGDVNYVTLNDFETIYKIENGHTIYLSNDESVYVEPPQPDPDVETPPYVPTEEELLSNAKVSKKKEMSNSCEQMIYDGTDVVLSNGTIEHFSLTEHDQLNLFGKQAQLVAGVSQLEYHADGKPCRYYSVDDMQLIIQAAMWHVSYHTTYCNALNMWISGCDTVDAVNEIYYGADIPDEYKNEVMTSYIEQVANIGVIE